MKLMAILIGGLIMLSASVFGFGPKKTTFKDIKVPEFVELIKDEEVVILDIRTVQELGTGFVEGAINIDFYANDFKAQLDNLDKTKKYIIYCRSGNRSGRALRVMKGLGFVEVYNLLGGIGALVRSGYPLVEPI